MSRTPAGWRDVTRLACLWLVRFVVVAVVTVTPFAVGNMIEALLLG